MLMATAGTCSNRTGRRADLARRSLLQGSQGTLCCRAAAGHCEATARFRDKTNTRRVSCLDEAMRTHDGSEKRGWMTDGVSPSVVYATAAGRVTAHCDASGRPDSTRATRATRATRTTRVEGALSGRLFQIEASMRRVRSGRQRNRVRHNKDWIETPRDSAQNPSPY